MSSIRVWLFPPAEPEGARRIGMGISSSDSFGSLYIATCADSQSCKRGEMEKGEGSERSEREERRGEERRTERECKDIRLFFDYLWRLGSQELTLSVHPLR
jgi:hypothetical protein